jgi:hypothetical protein
VPCERQGTGSQSAPVPLAFLVGPAHRAQINGLLKGSRSVSAKESPSFRTGKRQHFSKIIRNWNWIEYPKYFSGHFEQMPYILFGAL